MSLVLLATGSSGGCRSPQSIRIEKETANPKCCHDYETPSNWVSWQSTGPPPHRHASGFGYELRKAGPQYLIRGTHRSENGVLTVSPNLFFLAREGRVRPATEADWQAADPVDLFRKPSDTYKEEALTRVSPDGRLLLRIRHQQSEGLMAHRAVATLMVSDIRSGKHLWTGSGAAPQLPPIEQFEKIAWVDDTTLLWPRNAAATRLTICWDVGR